MVTPTNFGLWIWPNNLQWSDIECVAGWFNIINLNYYNWLTGEPRYRHWPYMMDRARKSGVKCALQIGEEEIRTANGGLFMVEPVKDYPNLHSVVMWDEPYWCINRRSHNSLQHDGRWYTQDDYKLACQRFKVAMPKVKLSCVQAGGYGLLTEDQVALRDYAQYSDYYGYDDYGINTHESFDTQYLLQKQRTRELKSVSGACGTYAVLYYSNARTKDVVLASIRGAVDGGVDFVYFYCDPNERIKTTDIGWINMTAAIEEYKANPSISQVINPRESFFDKARRLILR